MKACEDCEDECKRRFRCPHCNLLVCGWCWNHVHGCGPNHRPSECRDKHPELKGAAMTITEQARVAAEEIFAFNQADDYDSESKLIDDWAAIITKHVQPPSITEAIDEVKRLRDWWYDEYEHYKLSGAPTAMATYRYSAADEIITALEALQGKAGVNEQSVNDQYDQGRHHERKRTMQLIGAVRMDAQTGGPPDVLDRLVMAITSELLPHDEMPRRWCSVHQRLEFKYESLEHEIESEKVAATTPASEEKK